MAFEFPERITKNNFALHQPSYPVTSYYWNKLIDLFDEAVETISAERSVVDETTAGTMSLNASNSGRIYLFDKADGLTIILPTASAGLEYEFLIVTAVTSNSYGIDTDGTDTFIGNVQIVDKDQLVGSTEAMQSTFVCAGTEIHVDIAGDTTGGRVGGYLKVTAVNNSSWFISGKLIGDGVIATIFS